MDESENKSPRPDAGSENNTATSRRTKRLNTSFFLTWFIMFAFWNVFSGRFDVFHIILGIISCTIVAWISGDLIFSSPVPRGLIFLWLRFLRYIPWLLYQIFHANLHVIYLVFHPRMMELINPHIITFNSRLTSDYSRTKFRKIKQQLKQFIYHYENRILAFHIHKVLGYKAAYYNLISD